MDQCLANASFDPRLVGMFIFVEILPEGMSPNNLTTTSIWPRGDVALTQPLLDLYIHLPDRAIALVTICYSLLD